MQAYGLDTGFCGLANTQIHAEPPRTRLNRLAATLRAPAKTQRLGAGVFCIVGSSKGLPVGHRYGLRPSPAHAAKYLRRNGSIWLQLALIPKGNEHLFPSFAELRGHEVELTGIIRMRDGYPIMMMTDGSQLRVLR